MALFHRIKRAEADDYARKEQEKVAEILAKSAERNASLQSSNPALRGRKPDPNSKKLLTLRLDPDVIEAYKSTGDGWQTKMNSDLRAAVGLKPRE